jgi:hypothetical protein
MYKKNLVFGSLAFLGITLLILTGCPNVVNDGPNNQTPPVLQDDVTVTTAEDVPTGASVLGLKLAKGQFKTTAVALSNFKIDSNAPPAGAAGKLSPDRKVLVITGLTLTAGNKVTLFIPKEALEGDVVVATDVTIEAVGIQGAIAAKESTADVAADDNAIKVTLKNGFFISSATAADFEHDSAITPTSKIKTGDTSEVSISADGKTATIYGLGENTEGTVGTKAKIGIKASALVGYPIVAAADVTVTTEKETGQQAVTKSIPTPANGDNYITLTIAGTGTGKFVAAPLLTAFTIRPATGADAIAIGAGSVKVSADGKKAVIKVETKSDGTAAFKVKIAASAFSAETSDPIVLADHVTAATTKQGVVPYTIPGTNNISGSTLTIGIANGGKFKSVASTGNTGLGISDFTNTATPTPAVIATGTITLDAAKTTATVPLTVGVTGGTAYSFNINAAAFDDSWLVTTDDITVTPGT